jgi:ectoine hydroxylase-related dioxygenase (phytanoyl-CoA dioxygenase family)
MASDQKQDQDQNQIERFDASLDANPHSHFREWADYFHKHGYIILDHALDEKEVKSIKDELEVENKKTHKARHLKEKRHVKHTCFFEKSPSTVKLIGTNITSDFAEYLIADVDGYTHDSKTGSSLTAHVFHNNAFSIPPGGRGQAPSWHIDDPPQNVIVPKGRKLPSWVKLPVLACTYMIWLSDCDTVENGPTHVLPGSHRYGCKVDVDILNLPQNQNRIVACTGKAGTAVLVNSQTWHRGAANTSDQYRHTLQISWGRRIIGHKYDTIMNYQMPKHVITQIEKLKIEYNLPTLSFRMGFLPMGAYS